MNNPIMCYKDKCIKELKQALRQLVAYNKHFLKTHISNRQQLKVLLAEAESALRGDDRRNPLIIHEILSAAQDKSMKGESQDDDNKAT